MKTSLNHLRRFHPEGKSVHEVFDVVNVIERYQSERKNLLVLRMKMRQKWRNCVGSSLRLE